MSEFVEGIVEVELSREDVVVDEAEGVTEVEARAASSRTFLRYHPGHVNEVYLERAYGDGSAHGFFLDAETTAKLLTTIQSVWRESEA